ncbi:hypothetical protein PILCRDRAFT_12594 [Piloderma croceum F 1598]|uniref:Uncharacterized protein n=1 Tax=Piloderma croceum (strain F 1598) TaxID=765440 RepID=A0A0C3AS29_PILCF|nr:hypothetical protein PILCRDRAFT_12594 [Piloderma croceum F 1598]
MRSVTSKVHRGLSHKSSTRSTTTRRVGNSNCREIIHTVLRASKQNERIATASTRRQTRLQMLSAEDHAIASEMDHHYTTHDYGDTDNAYIAPGDEGFEFSHGGGEYADFDSFRTGFGELAGRRVDDRTRRDRTDVCSENWEKQTDALVVSYLEWKAADEKMDSEGSAADNDDHTIGMRVIVEELDVFYRTMNTYYMRQSDVYSNAALVRGGCLGTAPLFPSTAFSLRTLEVYRQTHRVCPRVSIQAEVRPLPTLAHQPILNCV